ncbi:MAG TPA: hypothetical protein QF623_04675, partial [SAR324 cluster bacterium]|nr:hypothetical protein [SAR324 cluster bacterium]
FLIRRTTQTHVLELSFDEVGQNSFEMNAVSESYQVWYSHVLHSEVYSDAFTEFAEMLDVICVF